jgi:hypothetical protein
MPRQTPPARPPWQTPDVRAQAFANLPRHAPVVRPCPCGGQPHRSRRRPIALRRHLQHADAFACPGAKFVRRQRRRHRPSAERHDQTIHNQTIGVRGALSPDHAPPHSRSAALLSRSAPPPATAAFAETLSGRTEVAKEDRHPSDRATRESRPRQEGAEMAGCGIDSRHRQQRRLVCPSPPSLAHMSI